MFSSLLLFYSLNFLACSNESTKDSVLVCDAPVASAGENQTLAYGQMVSLDASASTWCEGLSDNVTLNWRFIQTPTSSTIDDSSLSDNGHSSAIAPQFLPDVVGEYVLSLEINDGISEKSEDFVVINIQAGDLPPSADCGGAYTGKIGEIVTINGSLSSDPEGQILEYQWSLSPPACSALTSDSLYNEAGTSPVFVPDCNGVYVVGLVVSDGNQLSEPALCSVDVASSNRIPVADAGPSSTLGGCSSNILHLNGYASYDLDGDALVYEWSVVSVPTGSTVTNSNLSDAGIPTPLFEWDLPGTYTLQLQVYDGEDWSAPDVVSYTIGELADNQRPVANAGENQSIEVSASCDDDGSSYSTGECADCPASNIILDGTGSIDPNGDLLTFSWTEETGNLQALGSSISVPTSAVTDVMIPPRAYSSGTITDDYQFVLTVADCERSDDDTVYVTYSCSGN